MGVMDSSESSLGLYEEKDLLGRIVDKAKDSAQQPRAVEGKDLQSESTEDFDSFSDLNDHISEFLAERYEALGQGTILEQIDQNLDSFAGANEGLTTQVSSIEPAAGNSMDTVGSGLNAVSGSGFGDTASDTSLSFNPLKSYGEIVTDNQFGSQTNDTLARLQSARNYQIHTQKDVSEPDIAQVIVQKAEAIKEPVFAVNPYVKMFNHNLEDFHDRQNAGTGSGGVGSSAPFGTPQEFADFMISGYWGDISISWQDTDITYKIANRFTAENKAGITDAMNLWAEVTNLTFTKVNNGQELKFNEDRKGRAFSQFQTVDPGPSEAEFYTTKAKVNIDQDVTGWDDLHTVGLYGLNTAIHEIGHAIGLGHPGPYNGSADYATDAIWSNDSRQFSVMSYFDASNTGADHEDLSAVLQYASTPLVYDVFAIQQKYGANYTTRAEDTIYGFNSNAGRDQFDFSITSAPVVTVWDGGGTDTIDLSGYSMDQAVCLGEGHFSDIGGLIGNVSIAYGAVIENAIGGSGHDTLEGNDVANILNGGAGDDTLYGGGGDDILIGGTGNNYFDGGAGNDTVQFDDTMETFTGVMSGDNLIMSLGATIVATVTDTVEGFIFNGVSYSSADVIYHYTNGAPEVTVNDIALNDGQSAIASTIISAIDLEGDSFVYTLRDNSLETNSAYLRLDGVILSAGTDHSLTQSELDRLEIFGAARSGADEILVSASDGHSVSAPYSLDVNTTNLPPVGNVAPSPYWMEYGANTLVSDLVSYTDAVQESVRYDVKTDNANQGYLELDGVQLQDDVYHRLTDAEYNRLRFFAPNDDIYQTIIVIGSDGEHTDAAQQVDIRSQLLNDLPVITVSGSISATESARFLLRDYVSVTDPDGDTLSVLINDVDFSFDTGHMELDGVILSQNQFHTLTMDEFNRLELVGGSISGQNRFDIRAFDGYSTTNISTLSIVTDVPNATPIVFVDQPVGIARGEQISASSVITASDANGDTLSFQMIDTTSGGAYLELSGTELAAGVYHNFTQAEFDLLNIVADSDVAMDSMKVRAYDGREWSGLTTFSVASENTAAEVTVGSAAVNQDNIVLLSSLVNATDVENDELTYFISDKVAGLSSYLRLDGVRLFDYSWHEFTAAEFARVELVGGSTSQSNKYDVRVYDGESYSDYESFNVTSLPDSFAPNNKPTIDASGLSVVSGEVVRVSSFISADDFDGDTLSFGVYDERAVPGSGYFRLDGAELSARTYHALTQAEFDRLEIVADTAGFERFRVYASDGSSSSGVERFKMRTYDDGDRVGAAYQGDTVVGDDTSNSMRGSNGDETFYSRGGADDVYGRGGADDFVFEAGSAFSGVDTIHDFDAVSGDRLDIADILSGFYDDQTDVLTDFVRVTDNGTDSTLSVDQDGGADNFVDIATVKNVIGLTDEDRLVLDGNLIV